MVYTCSRLGRHAQTCPVVELDEFHPPIPFHASVTQMQIQLAFTPPIVILQNHSKSTEFNSNAPWFRRSLSSWLVSRAPGPLLFHFPDCSSLLCLTPLKSFPFIVCSWTPHPASSLCLPDAIHVMNAPSPFPFVTLLLQCVTVNTNQGVENSAG